MNGPAGPISEADILWDLASRLEGRMTAIGMETFLSRPVNRAPSDAERAATANTVGADLMLSLRCAAQASPAANGVASFHFGNSHGSVSTIGRNAVPTSFSEKWWRAPDYVTAAPTGGPGTCCG